MENRFLFQKLAFVRLPFRNAAHTDPTPKHPNPYPVAVVDWNCSRVSKVEPDFQALNRSRCPKVSIFRRGFLRNLLNRGRHIGHLSLRDKGTRGSSF